MCFVHCSQQINVGCRVVLCEPVPPVASLLYLTSFFVSSNQPRHLGPAQPCHRCHVLPQQTLNRALLFPIFLIANRARHPFIDLMPSSRLEPNLLAGLQKCPDLFQAQFFCVLHAYLQSQACEIQSPSGSCCVINTVALQAHPALYKTDRPGGLSYSAILMIMLRVPVALLLGITLAFTLSAQPKKKKLLAIGAVKGFQHDSVSHALATIEWMGRESGIYDTHIKTDTQLITNQKLKGNAKKLDHFDAILFYTTGELDMDEQQKKDLLSFVGEDGKGFIGVHSATDTFYKWPEFGELIGGWFKEHPWGVFDAPVVVEDSNFPGMQGIRT